MSPAGAHVHTLLGVTADYAAKLNFGSAATVAKDGLNYALTVHDVVATRKVVAAEIRRVEPFKSGSNERGVRSLRRLLSDLGG